MSTFVVVIERRVLVLCDAIERGTADILEVRVCLIKRTSTLGELQCWSMTAESGRSIGAEVVMLGVNEFEAPAPY